MEAAAVRFDKKEQLDQITPWITPTEQLRAVFDLTGWGTGFVAITDRRLIFYDKAFGSKKRKALTSVPYNKLTSVSSVDTGGNFMRQGTSELVLRAGSQEFEFEFHGPDKAHDAYQMIMMEILENEPA